VLRHRQRMRVPVDSGRVGSGRQVPLPIRNAPDAEVGLMPVAADETLWRDLRARLVRFVRRRVADDATAEDIAHDALARAYASRDTLRMGDRLEPWLYQITRNAVVDHYRRRRPTEPLPPDLVATDAADHGDARHELAQCVAPLVHALPAHYRDAIVLAELEGRTQQETADALGMTLSGAKSRVQRGRRMLAEKLLACCRIECDARGGIVEYESREGCGGCDT
jgi:RNA polymerase sigma-70 factor (ECF subfamily)